MSRFQDLLCFTILLATVTFFNVALAHVKIKLALPQTGGPISVGDVEPYTVKVVSTFVADLEKECAKTKKVRHFFEKVNALSECVCSVSKVKDRESHMKAKAGSLFQAISALGSDENGFKGGKVNKLQKEKTEAMETVKMLQSIGEKITGGKSNGTLKLTTKQQKEIKDGILEWLNVINRISKKADEISMKSSSISETKKESKEEKSVGTRILAEKKSSTKSNKNSDKGRDNKKKGSDNKKNKKGESKKKKHGGQEGHHGSAKSKGGSDDDKSSKNKRRSSENSDKNHQTKYGKVEKKKGGVEQSRNKTAERLRAEAADELD
ncbi:Uncharacterized protein Rs2_03272 [Raphanus sativus]|uniref:Uncharacterized protein LOC108858486 n=1 Tax=Raphanus sativus TaxID=3726 RepID=A0A6J0NT06_RAPSA|nr:uncharacterized protein LOC108858486 [Raphanus sativus]KAJ4917722.1 Uncharacterized protein Rs2_03272 [Raphanus sativus]